MSETNNKNIGIGCFTIIAIGGIFWLFSTVFGTNFEDPNSVQKAIQGTWVVHQKDGSSWNHCMVNFTDSRYNIRFATSEREKYDNWNSIEFAEGTFDIGDIKTFTNANDEYRPILFHGNSMLADLGTRMIYYDKTMGLYWSRWGSMKKD